MKKSPVAAGFLELIPTAGYAYSRNWGRGLIIRFAIPVVTLGVAIPVDYISSEVSIALYYMFLAELIIIPIYSMFDAVSLTLKYNESLYKEIFRKERSNIAFNLYPLQDGAGISLTYSFN